jgi:hypothetical protein
MSGYISDSFQSYSPLNPVPIYNKNLPANYDNHMISQPAYNQKNLKIPRTQNANRNYQNDNIAWYYEKYDMQGGSQNYDRARMATQSLFEKNDITKMFFSNENIARIQQKIRNEVSKRSKGQYILDEDQDEADLVIVMRAIYLDKCKNLPGETIRQVKILNEQTVDYLMPDLMSNIKQYFGYIRDINQPLQPMILPLNTSSSGRKILPSITTLYR